MKKFLILFILFFSTAVTALADDLYKVNLRSAREAESLRALGVEALLWVDGGYLVLADHRQSEAIRQQGFDFALVASDIRRERLVLDGRMDDRNAGRFPIIFESEGTRLFLLEGDPLTAAEPGDLIPLMNEHLSIEYYPPRPVPEVSVVPNDVLQALVDEVNQDSLFSYVSTLQNWVGRTPGSDPNAAARDWIYDKFVESGYDSVWLDPFTSYVTDCHNVVACKEGTLYPETYIVIGAHFDAVANCPGADDNASGTAGVLEIARVLKDVELPITLIFVAFDAEEVGLLGSKHYASEAFANGDDIVCMLDMDMIGATGNSDKANLFHGPVDSYAILWNELGKTYAGITGVLSGTTGGSDHYPFQQLGYDVCFSIEYFFSMVYHSPDDNTDHMDFDYMTRMVRANLATAFTVAGCLPPVRITSIQDPNDGQSLVVYWQQLDPAEVEHYTLYYFPTSNPEAVTPIDLPSSSSSHTVDGLTDGEEYAFYVKAFSYEGYITPTYDYSYAIPNSILNAPDDIIALPMMEAVKLTWSYDTTDLNLSHCAVLRDGVAIAELIDTSFIDDDPSLGSILHYYRVVAVDSQGICSDTLGSDPVLMKVATLQPERILAINRSTRGIVDLVDQGETESLMHQALSDFSYDYIADTTCDTVPDDPVRLKLYDLVDYGIIVVGGEAAGYDDIGANPDRGGGFLNLLAYYLSIGGRAVVFGRWGSSHGALEYIDYSSPIVTYDDAYHDLFHIDRRASSPTLWIYALQTFVCDLTGAGSSNGNYPQLVWDSSLTLAHSNACRADVVDLPGIPYASFVELNSPQAEVLYTYRSRDALPPMEGQPVAWRYLGEDYQYVYFDIPLSFFERDSAIAALQQAIDDLTFDPPEPPDEPVVDEEELPGSYALHQNYPNPFNPGTEIVYSLPQASDVTLTIYNILGQKVATLVNAQRDAGTHHVFWYGTDEGGQAVATGIYLYRLEAGNFKETKKMLFLK